MCSEAAVIADLKKLWPSRTMRHCTQLKAEPKKLMLLLQNLYSLDGRGSSNSRASQGSDGVSSAPGRLEMELELDLPSPHALRLRWVLGLLAAAGAGSESRGAEPKQGRL